MKPCRKISCLLIGLIGLVTVSACSSSNQTSTIADETTGTTTFSDLTCTLLQHENGGEGDGYFKVSGTYTVNGDGSASLERVQIETGRYQADGSVTVSASYEADNVTNDESYRPRTGGRWENHLRFDFADLGMNDIRLIIAQEPKTPTSQFINGALNNYRSYRYLSCRFARETPTPAGAAVKLAYDLIDRGESFACQEGDDAYSYGWRFDEDEYACRLEGYEVVAMSALPFRLATGQYLIAMTADGRVSLDYDFGDSDGTFAATLQIPSHNGELLFGDTPYTLVASGGDNASGAWGGWGQVAVSYILDPNF